MDLLTTEERTHILEVADRFCLYSDDARDIGQVSMEAKIPGSPDNGRGGAMVLYGFVEQLAWNPKHTIIPEAEYYFRHVPLIEDVKDRGIKELRGNIEDILKTRTVDTVLDVPKTQKALMNPDILNLTIASMQLYSTAYRPRLTGPEGNPDWFTQGWKTQTKQNFYAAPSYNYPRQFQQRMACCELSDRPYSNNINWFYGKDAVDKAINDPEIMRAYVVNEKEILERLTHVEKAKSITMKTAREKPFVGMWRESIDCLKQDSQFPDLNYDHHRASPKSVISYLEKNNLELSQKQKYELTVALEMGVISPYEISSLAKPENNKFLNQALIEWKELVPQAQKITSRDLDEYELNEVIYLVRTIRDKDHSLDDVAKMGVLINKIMERDPLIQKGWIRGDNYNNFYDKTLEGDREINHRRLEEYNSAIENTYERKIANTR